MTVLLGLSAVNTGNNLLFLVVSGLLAFMSVTGIAGMLNIKGLTPVLIAPDEVFTGTAARFQVRIENSKRHLPSFLIRVDCPGGEGLVLPIVPAGSTLEQGISVTMPKRGHASIATVTLSSPFPVSFFTRYWIFPLDDRFVVFPRMIATHLPAGGDEGGGARDTRFRRGDEGEFEGLSPYSGAEPLRQIHWKHFARSGELLVKQRAGLSASTLDIDLKALPGRDLEERISRAAWLVRHWSVLRPVSLVIGTERSAALCGRRHGLRLLRRLALHALD